MECPYCKKEIKLNATKCKHCYSILNEKKGLMEITNVTLSLIISVITVGAFLLGDFIDVLFHRNPHLEFSPIRTEDKELSFFAENTGLRAASVIGGNLVYYDKKLSRFCNVKLSLIKAEVVIDGKRETIFVLSLKSGVGNVASILSSKDRHDTLRFNLDPEFFWMAIMVSYQPDPEINHYRTVHEVLRDFIQHLNCA